MPFTLSVISGPSIGASYPIPDDGTITVGRLSTHVDFAVTRDEAMSKTHFSISGGDHHCTVQDLGSTGGTFVKGERIKTAYVHPGDDIRAGTTRFKLEIRETSSPAAVPAASQEHDTSLVMVMERPTIPPEAPAAPPSPPEPVDAGGFRAIKALDLLATEATDVTEEARAVASPIDTCAGFLQRLEQKKLLADAVRFAAHALPRRKAVWWACRCLKDPAAPPLSETDLTAVSAAEAWVVRQTEEERRRAEKAAAALGHATAAAWAATSAFWAGPTLAPEGVPAVPPAPDLAARAARGAAALAAVFVQPEKADARYAAFVRLAHQIAAAPEPWKS